MAPASSNPSPPPLARRGRDGGQEEPSRPTRKRSRLKRESVREKITKGTYKFAPAELAFDIKNGTLRFAPATLTTLGAETKINGFVELASLKLDSEWAMGLTGDGTRGRASGEPRLYRRAQQGGRDFAGDRYRGDRGLSHHAAHAGGRGASGDARRERQDRARRDGARGTEATLPEELPARHLRRLPSRSLPTRQPGQPRPRHPTSRFAAIHGLDDGIAVGARASRGERKRQSSKPSRPPRSNLTSYRSRPGTIAPQARPDETGGDSTSL